MLYAAVPSFQVKAARTADIAILDTVGSARAMLSKL